MTISGAGAATPGNATHGNLSSASERSPARSPLDKALVEFEAVVEERLRFRILGGAT